MKVMREVKVKADHFEVGDRIKVKLPGAKYTATAILDEGDGMLFIFDQYFDGAMPMNKNGGTDGGYDGSDMRAYLRKVAETFPEKLKKRMVKFENGDFLRLLTLQEMCGKDENFNDCDGQIPWMKQDRRHRIASRKGDEYELGWLATVVSGAHFAFVSYTGNATYRGASDSLGVRPAFKIFNRAQA